MSVLNIVCYSSYLAGTEDGLIHRCSCSYTEQYLKSFDGHTVRILVYITYIMLVYSRSTGSCISY